MDRALRHVGRRGGIEFALVAVLLGLAVLLLLPAACVTTTPAGGTDSKVAGHAVHGDELVRVMSRIERFRRQSWPQEVESEYESDRAAGTERAFRQAQRVATQLSDAAGLIADVAQRVDMAEADRRAFLAQVDVLKAQVKHLESVTADRNADAMRKALRRIDTTCRSCHSRFRDVAGPM